MAAARICVLVATSTGFAADPPRNPTAMALLRGVELARGKYDNLRLELDMEYADRERHCTVACLLEQAGGRRRFEQFAGGCLQVGIVAVIDGPEARGLRRKEHADLGLYDATQENNISAEEGFDPRNLGVDGIPLSHTANVRDLLWIEKCDRADLVGREELQGTPTWHLKTWRGDATADLWIEEPLFRVHRIVAKEDGISAETDSQFDPTDRTSPFPRRVEMTYQDGRELRRIVITVKNFEADKKIPTERFTMKAMDVPVNTMINDYRVNRILGYWDGEGVSPNPVQHARTTGSPPTVRNVGWIYAVTVFSLIVVGAVGAWLYFRRRKARATRGV